MEHLSNDELTALALGHEAEHEHLASCEQCRAEVASLRRAADRYRAAEVPALVPPAGIWDRIASEIADDDAAVAARGGATAAADASPAADVSPTAGVSPAAEDPHAADASPTAGVPPAADGSPVADASSTAREAAPARREAAHVAPRRRRRFSTAALLAACAASAAVAASVAVLLVSQLGAGPRTTDVANAVLDPLESTVSVAPARAEIVERDGQRLLIVDVDSLPEVDGYLDVWLLDAQAQQMVSLGVMDAESTQLALPPGLDLATYPIVDVSIEPYDGDPTHSGNSIWRGALEL